MSNFNIRKQINRLYASGVLGNLSLTGAWVAILTARGFSLPQVGIAEAVFHLTSLIFEIPSGVLADVLGRKKMLIISSIMRVIGNIIMILSFNLLTVCLSIAFHALSYNFASGSGEALAYDSLKSVSQKEKYEKYVSTQLIIYRLFGGISTLCAGFALYIGHRIAYGVDVVTCIIEIIVLSGLVEIYSDVMKRNGKTSDIMTSIRACYVESFRFMKSNRKAFRLMFFNSLVGSFDILLLFFIQAKFPEVGVTGLLLGVALFITQIGGIVGSRIILLFKKVSYRTIYFVSLFMVIGGVLVEHSGFWVIMAIGGFISAMGDDALQIRTNKILQDMFPSEQRATLTSIDSFIFSMIMIVLSPLAGLFFAIW